MFSRMDQVKFVKDSFLKIRSHMFCLNRPYHFKFLKTIAILGPFLKTLSQMIRVIIIKKMLVMLVPSVATVCFLDLLFCAIC